MNTFTTPCPTNAAKSAELNLPLLGVKVIDMARGPLAAIGRQLAELGAEVIRVEPVGGACDRHQGPSVAGIALDFIAANLGKQAVALDLTSAADRIYFDEYLGLADILIENCEPGSKQAECLDIEQIHRRFPALVILSASSFSKVGLYSQWQATSPIFHALSGELARSGIPGRAPLLPPGDLPYDCAVPQAAFVILVAYLNRLETGVGDHLDFSVMDAATQALDPGYGITGSATGGTPASLLPRDRPEARHQYPIFACADGYVRICILSKRQWQSMFEWLGRPSDFSDPSFDILQVRYASATLLPAIARFFANRKRVDLENEGQRFGVPTAAMLDLSEALESEHVLARGLFKPVALTADLSAPFPDGVMHIDGVRAGIRGPAPSLAEPHQQPLFTSPPVPNSTHAPRPEAYGKRPLAGLKVLDLGVIVVGAETGRLLADQGAEVIKIENSAFPDGIRNFVQGCKISVSFAAGHRNKQSLGLNLREPEGKELFLQLVAQADVVLSNFKPGTLDSLGLTHEVLSKVNPGIITVDSSAFGAYGPWSRRLGYGPLVRASTGLTTQWCYPDEPGSFSDAITIYPDHVGGRIGAMGVLSLLIRRHRTARGGSVSVAQSEVMLGHMASQVASLSLAAKGYRLDARAHRDAPWGVFRCAGEDEWCVVTVRGSEDWIALCGVLNRPDLLADPSLANRESRDAHRALIDNAVSQWLTKQPPHTAMTLLQQAGVPAAAMLRVSDLPKFDYFKERQLFCEVQHPLIDEPFYLETAPVRSRGLPTPLHRPAPLIGEQTIALAQEKLGLSLDRIADLIQRNVLESPEQPDTEKNLPKICVPLQCATHSVEM